MANYDSKFNINEAFEEFKQKQEGKGRISDLKISKTATKPS